MRKTATLIILMLFIGLTGALHAQDDTGTNEDEKEPLYVVVEVESMFARAAPSQEAEAVASVFEDDKLEVVGRSLDGTWFEVRRRGRFTNLGWLFAEMLDWDFAPEYLPLTDFDTGLIGPTPLAQDPGFAIFVLEGVALRAGPGGQYERILNVPPSVTLPVIARDYFGDWLKVNYLGHEGWIISFTIREVPYLMDIPLAKGLPPLQAIPFEIIPPEVQFAQVQRLRDFSTPKRDIAQSLETFWWAVYRGEVMPCDAPADVVAYQYSNRDIQELPELSRYLPQVERGVTALNKAIDPLQSCGVLTADEVIRARNSAINAKLEFNAVLERLKSLEETIK